MLSQTTKKRGGRGELELHYTAWLIMSGHITHPQSWVYFHTKTLAFLPNKGCHICRESWVTQAASARDLLLCCWMQRWWGYGRSSSLTPSEAKEADVEASSGWFMSGLVLMEQLCGLRTKCVLCHAQGISSNLLGDIRFLRSSSKLWAAPTAPLGPCCLCNKEGISGKVRWESKTHSCKKG